MSEHASRISQEGVAMRGRAFSSRLSVGFVLVLVLLNLASCGGSATTREAKRNLTGTPSTVFTTTPGANGSVAPTPNAGATTIPPTTPASGPKVTRGVFIVTGHNVAIQHAIYTILPWTGS
jgi:hypothetical protein